MTITDLDSAYLVTADCLRLITALNRRLDDIRRFTADDADESMFILAESAQENLRDVRMDLQRIRIILEMFPRVTRS